MIGKQYLRFFLSLKFFSVDLCANLAPHLSPSIFVRPASNTTVSEASSSVVVGCDRGCFNGDCQVVTGSSEEARCVCWEGWTGPRSAISTGSPIFFTFLHSIISQSRARDNTAATTLPCFQAIKWLSNIAKCLYSVWVLHLDTEARTCIVFFLVTEA